MSTVQETFPDCPYKRLQLRPTCTQYALIYVYTDLQIQMLTPTPRRSTAMSCAFYVALGRVQALPGLWTAHPQDLSYSWFHTPSRPLGYPFPHPSSLLAQMVILSSSPSLSSLPTSSLTSTSSLRTYCVLNILFPPPSLGHRSRARLPGF